MGLIRYIRNQKPDVRAKYAFFLAVGITGAIGLVWVTTLPAQFEATTFTFDVMPETSEFNALVDDAKMQAANTIGSFEPAQESTFEASNLGNLNTVTDGTSVEEGGSEDGSAFSEEGVTADDAEVALAATTTTKSEVYTRPEPKVILIGTTTLRTTEQ